MKPCSHCHIEYDESALHAAQINGKDEFFCCRGCEGVFRLLSDFNLTNFYDKIGQTTLSPPKERANDLAKFDSEAYAQKYIKTRTDGTCEVSLIIEGIHCIACVWLNQKILNATSGVISADINFTNNKAKIVFDSGAIKLSEIIQKIRAIGYNAEAYDPKILERANAKNRKNYYTRLIVALFCTMNIMWIAVAQYSGYFLGMEQDIKDILNFAGFCLATPTLFYSGFIFFRSGYFGLKNGLINMDLLVAVGASLTYFYSIYAAIWRSGETYFESATMIITFVLVGKFLEILARKNAGDSIDKLNLSIPATISVLRENQICDISPQEVRIGDIIEVKPGEKIIIDGVLLSPSATIDNSMLTGESALEGRAQGEALISGGINCERVIKYRATRTFEDSTMNNIITLIQDSAAKKPLIETRANAISYHFSAFVIICAIAAFALWCAISGGERAMIVAVSVIIIACPCALALATPIATIVGITEAYRRKILFKEARFLESFAKSDVVVFDKTGTLTFGAPKVISAVKVREFDAAALRAFVALNNHPISKGICAFLDAQNGDSGDLRDLAESRVESRVNLSDFTQSTQKGICAVLRGDSSNSDFKDSADSKNAQDSTILGGSRAFLQENGVEIPQGAENDEFMKFYYAVDGQLVAIFNLQDSLKNGANEVVSAFQKSGFRVIILSGDRAQSVQRVARELNIAEFHAQKSPIDKSDFIDKLHAQGHRVIFVGDGINDAIALNKSDIAISMGAGSDIAIESSDIVLLDDSLGALLSAHRIAQRTYSAIKQNIGISICYNLLTIPLAMAGLVIPLFAAASMSVSSILVVLNSMRIRRI